MNVLGSVFVGDASRTRSLASNSPSSTPPTSPKRQSGSNPPSSPLHFKSGPEKSSVLMASGSTLATPAAPPPPPIDPELSLELRIRWLEALLLGVKQDGKEKKGKVKDGGGDGDTLVRRTEIIQRKVQSIVEANDGLRKFMERYDQHAQILNPSFAQSETSTEPSYASMSPSELDAFLSEMEPEIKSADRDLREIETLLEHDVLGAGKLKDYEALLPRLNKVMKAHEEDLQTAAKLEKRIGGLLKRHATHVDALSELFVEWNDALTEAEDKVSKLEREHEEKRRLGYE
ncbi:hypothetical protein BD410DRAFT_774448 [Rickenella mellea]|uniref:Uncharacterized protein n=1 Tax=Rickenella mellea TaxID=50990 RepID=A0A4Y7PWB0_9AGAM|nr:hypothetical protein BD410DRAFT_774448 [Rickenella mellea]